MAYRELELTLVSAQDLKNVNLITRMDVYAVVTISGDHLTRQCTAPDPSGGRNPRWDARLRFAVPPTADAAAGQCLHVLLRAERVLGDRDIGEVVIPLADLLAGAPAAGPQQPRVASYQVRKVHRWEPRGVLHVSYRLGPVVAPVVENKPPAPAVMGTAYPYPPVGVPSSQPFQTPADAYQPPPAQHPRPATKANKHDPAPAPSPSPRNGLGLQGPTQVCVGPHTQIILGGGGGGPPATATTMSSSSPTGSNVSSPRKPYGGAWHTKQEDLHLHHGHGDTTYASAAAAAAAQSDHPKPKVFSQQQHHHDTQGGRRSFQEETEATSQLRALVPAAAASREAAAAATVSPRGPSPSPRLPVSTFSSTSPPPYSTASQRAPVVAASGEATTVSPRGPSPRPPLSTFSSHGSSSSPAHPFAPSPSSSSAHSSTTNSPYTTRHPSIIPSPRPLGAVGSDAFGSSRATSRSNSQRSASTQGRSAVSSSPLMNSSPLVAHNHSSMVPSR